MGLKRAGGRCKPVTRHNESIPKWFAEKAEGLE
jgi:hypothetical protein